MTSEAQGGAGSYREDARHSLSPTNAVAGRCGPKFGHQGEGEDGLGVWRGITAALIIEASAVGLVWAVWHFAPRLAAWWRAL